MLETVLSLVGALAAICVVLALSYLFTRYVVGRTGLPRGLRGRHITILEQVPVGREQKLLLVQVGERVYLLGTSQGSVTYLRTVPEDAAAHPAPELSFQEALRNVIRQRKR